MKYKSGKIAIVGRPNVGKSTILNAIVGQKISIVSEKPQTTRTSLVGIAHRQNAELVFVDTPGIHTPHTRLDREMLAASKGALDHVDVILAVVDGAHHPGELDREVAKAVDQQGAGVPILVCLNKMDRLKAENVEPFIAAYCQLFKTEEYMLTQANRAINIDKLEEMIIAYLPPGEPQFEEDDLTDRSSKFLSAELVREQILNRTRQEIPYSCAVIVDVWEDEESETRIEATILVEKPSQRGILIGKNGQTLKEIGQGARAEIEALIGRHVYLGLHVKVEEGWRMNPRILHELEYGK